MTSTPDLVRRRRSDSSPPTDALTHERIAAAERDRFRALRSTRSRAKRDALIEEHLWIARHAARRFSGRGESGDDLFQVASLGLIKAVDRFDPDRGVRFVTFAMPTIMGELRRHFRDRTWSVRVSRRVQDLHLDLRAASERLTHELRRQPNIEELAVELDVTPEDILEAMEAGLSYRAASLDAPTTDAAEDASAQIVAEVDRDLQTTPERVVVQRALHGLRDRDRRAVYLRFYPGLTQSEIADELSVSQVHVSRILRASIDRLGDDSELRALEAG